MWALSFFGDPGRYCLCDGFGEVAFFAAESLDGLESQFFSSSSESVTLIRPMSTTIMFEIFIYALAR
jgi:hypothetical protein